LSPDELASLKKILDKYLDRKWIRESRSEWAAACFMVPKKTFDPVTGVREWRLVIDYRHLNKRSIKQAYPLPKIDEIFNNLRGFSWFSGLDFEAGYHQVQIKEDDKHKTGFVSPLGHFEFNVLPFGLHSAPPCFQRIMDHVLRVPKQEGWCFVYVDDVLICSTTLKEHIKKLEIVFKILEENKLTLRYDKCIFAKQEIEYLGHIIEPGGIRMNPNKISALMEFPVPISMRGLRRFLGITNYFKGFVKGYAEMILALTDLTKGLKKDPKAKKASLNPAIMRMGEPNPRSCPVWSEDCQLAFDNVKEALTTAPCLAFPDPSKSYHIITDASDTTVGGILLQDDHPISYWSMKLKSSQKNYPPYDKEAMAVIYALRQWKHLVLNSQPIVLHTDNSAVSMLMDHKWTNPRQARWCEELSFYGMLSMHHIPGVDNISDALTRQEMNALISHKWSKGPSTHNSTLCGMLSDSYVAAVLARW